MYHHLLLVISPGGASTGISTCAEGFWAIEKPIEKNLLIV
jgi:hypothetical protein